MANLVYFFPRCTAADALNGDRFDSAFLAAHGAGPALASIRDAQAEASVFAYSGTGPGGQSGLMVQALPARCPVPLRVGYFPKQQTWHERPCGADCWVGIDQEFPPTPAELLIPEQPRGHRVRLGDGQEYRVPILRSPFARDQMGRSQLPRAFGWDSRGQFVVTRKQSADELWEKSAAVWDHFFDRENHPGIELELVTDLAVRTLGMQYRIGPIEQQLLGLIDGDNWSQVCEALLDVPLVEEALGVDASGSAQKKTEPPPA